METEIFNLKINKHGIRNLKRIMLINSRNKQHASQMSKISQKKCSINTQDKV